MSKSYLIITTFNILTFSIASSGFGQYKYLESHVTNDLFDVCFYDSLKGWAVGDSATIITTNDGGMTWTRQFDPADSTEFTNVEFVNRWIGFVGGNRISRIPGELIYYPIILKTTDGGENWKECDLGLSQMPEYTDISFYDMDFLDSNTGWVAVNETNRRVGMLLGTENGGETWNLVREMSPWELIFTATIRDNNLGYILYGSAFDNFSLSKGAYTENGGDTWTSTGGIFSFYMNDLIFISPDTLWSIGTGIYKSHDRGINWIRIDSILSEKNFGRPRDLHAFNAQNILLIGRASSKTNNGNYSAVLINTRDGGENWNQLLAISQTDFNAFDVVSSQLVWIIGDKGLIIFINLGEITSVENTDIDPLSFVLKQNYPNPFNPSTSIKYHLHRSGNVQMKIHNLSGQEIETLIDGFQSTGEYEITWHPKGVPSGIYFYRLQVGEFTETKKLIIQK